MGFERVYSRALSYKENKGDWHFVYAHPDGLVVNIETIREAHLRSVLYYVWVSTLPEDIAAYYLQNYSTLRKNTYAGNHEFLEDPEGTLEALRKHGRFSRTWEEGVFVYLASREDYYCEDGTEKRMDLIGMNLEKLEQMPRWVLAFVYPWRQENVPSRTTHTLRRSERISKARRLSER